MKTLLSLAALVAIIPLAPAAAERPVNTAVVSFNASDIASPAGRSALDRRIARAAEQVCGTASDFDLAGQNQLRRCRTVTVTTANRDLATTLAARRSQFTVAANR